MRSKHVPWTSLPSAAVMLSAAVMAWPSPSLAQAGPGHRPDFVAVARGGAIIQSFDGGDTWSAASSPTTAYINGVVSDNRGRFVAVGARGTVLVSENGTTWRDVSPGLDAETILNAVAWDDDGRFVMVGSQGVVYVSVDGGITWQVGDSGVDETLLSVATDRAGTWIVGGVQGIVLRSTDGGEDWQAGTLGHGEHANDVAALGNDRWVAVGPQGSAAVSQDGGRSWAVVETGVDVALEGVAADSTGVVLAVGWQGSVLRSDDGGSSWSVVESGTTRRLAGVTDGPDGQFVAVGWSGTALRSADWGRTWSEASSDVRKVLQEVAYNRLPDLAVTRLALDERCRVVTEVRNGGPATLPVDAWNRPGTILRLSRDGEPWTELDLATLDPDRVLRPGGAAGLTLSM